MEEGEGEFLKLYLVSSSYVARCSRDRSGALTCMGRLGRLPLLNQGGDGRGLGRSVRGNGEGGKGRNRSALPPAR